jgi:hypothetical protein
VKAEIEQEIAKDERTETSDVQPSYSNQAQQLTIKVSAKPKDSLETFQLTLLVTQLGVELLTEE